jgi:N-dimethylarginine dimethylaminohydrolase
MNKVYGSQSMVARLERMMVRRPNEAFGTAEPEIWHYTAKPDLSKAQQEHDALVKILSDHGAEVVYHQEPLPNHADAIFVHDPVLVCDQGAILLRMGKELRKGEEAAIGKSLEAAGVPIHFELSGEALAEGGDLLWIDHDTLAVGIGYRTNLEGMRQLQLALPEVEILPVQLPYFQGPDACLHLMSTISMIADDLAVVYKPLTSVLFLQQLAARGIGFVEVPESEFGSMGPNVLAVSPRVCVMLEGNPVTKQRLEAADSQVYTYRGDEISLKAEGGATCLTRPILRVRAE